MATSLRRRLLQRLAIPLVLLLLIEAVVSYAMALRFSERAYDAGLNDSARALAQQVRFVAGHATLDLPREALEIIHWDIIDRTYFAVESAREGLIFWQASFPRPEEPPERELEPLYYDTAFRGEKLRAVAIRLTAQDDALLVLVGETLGKRNAMIRDIVLSMLLPELLFMFAALWVLQRGIRGALEPLRSVARQIVRRNPGDLEPLEEDGPEEVRPLTTALNDLLRALAEAQESQRRFIANAAHQLRTPLAALQIQCERALRETTPAAKDRALERLMRTSGRTAHLARQLLTLARAEQRTQARARFETLDAAALAREVSSEWVPAALESGTDLGYAGPEGAVFVEGDSTLVHEAIANLIDNALAYGRAGGSVTVGIRETGEDVEIYVEDNGPGIAPELREAVFERFMRIPGTRGDGCGLGLAIVRDIARLHRGSAWTEPVENGPGARFVIRMPRAARPPA